MKVQTTHSSKVQVDADVEGVLQELLLQKTKKNSSKISVYVI